MTNTPTPDELSAAGDPPRTLPESGSQPRSPSTEATPTQTPDRGPTSTPAPAGPAVEPAVYLSGPLLQSRQRRVRLPLLLFLITCLSTFWAGATNWQPLYYLSGNMMDYRQAMVAGWDQGLVYMACVLSILLLHEMGHFLTTLLYRVPASLPYFIPFPITPIGTMGAVIGMEGHRANRKEIFDIGLAGPLAGLIAAIPILWIGIHRLDLDSPAYGSEVYDCPLLVRWLIATIRPDHPLVESIKTSQLNPFFMAGWVGLLITGLNMLPISQLDGGHVTYALFGRRAHVIARTFLILSIVFVVFADAHLWLLMIVLVVFIGTDHPPTADDSVQIGWVRKAIGWASLIIPIACFPPKGLTSVF